MYMNSSSGLGSAQSTKGSPVGVGLGVDMTLVDLQWDMVAP